MAVLTPIDSPLQSPDVPEVPTLDNTEVNANIDAAYGSGMLDNVSGDLPTWETPTDLQTDITEGASYVTPESTVTGQLESLLSSDSPYMKQVENNSREQANSLGLLSSSMAVGAGQRAAIESAIPIATQDAQTFAAFQQGEQKAEYDVLKDINNTKLNAEYSKYKAEVDTLFQGAMKGADAKAQAAYDKVNKEWGTKMDLVVKDFDNKWQEKLANGQVSQERYNNAMTTIGNIQLNTQTNIAQILTDPDISAMDPDAVANMINNINQHASASIEFTAGVGGINQDELDVLLTSFNTATEWGVAA